ncbi:MAG: SLBB domain-containing protein [Treponema sp.]|jgi:electron transport complex protein RnfC|nr:SLBB domain-containing protein [Treponema sp.]
MKIYSFPRGGLPYDDPTAPGKTEAVNAYLPALSVISLGKKKKSAYPIVSVGEAVREGMLIGRAQGAGSANVHATVPGRILKKISWTDRDGVESDAYVIRMEGAFERLGRKEEVLIWSSLNGYDLQRIISDYGITKMENSETPLSEMISASRLEEKLTLVVRCVFDDPWLVADYALCRDRLHAVIEGAAIVAKACFKVLQIIFAVSHHEKDLGELLLSEAKNFETPASLVLTGCRYPQRNNRELELALRSYEKKEGLNLGSFLILGPAVLAAAYDAIKHKKPILDRYVAVGGSAVRRPQIMKVRIGTRIGEVIEQCGGFIDPPEKIVIGSPLSGREVLYLDEPVGKSCYAIVAMTKSQVAVHGQQNCINCGECRAVCPVGLDPQIIYKRLRSAEIENAEITGCQGCGCCKIVCPSALPLFETILEKDREEVSA